MWDVCSGVYVSEVYVSEVCVVGCMWGYVDVYRMI